MYQCGDNYYITRATMLDESENIELLRTALKHDGKIFVDGWTASINTSLQQYKEDIKLVF